MKQFINLSSIVINKLHITEIVKTPGKYSIYMTNSSVNGIFSFVLGKLYTTYNIIEICQIHHREDYKTITEWINTM